MTSRQASRPGSPNFLHWDDRSYAPSTWLGLWAALLKESCQLRSGTTLVHTIGVWYLGRLRRICRGIRGITHTQRLRKFGSATCYNPMDGLIRTAKFKRFEGWPAG